MNPFLALRDEEIRSFVDLRQERVRQRVEQRLYTAQFWGDIAELFLPRMADTLATMSGGGPVVSEDSFRTLPEEDEGGQQLPPADGRGPALRPPRTPGPDDRNEIIR